MKKMTAIFLVILWAFLPVVGMAAESTQTNVQIDLTAIITALIGLLATLITGYLLPFIKAKIGIAKYEKLVLIIGTLVEAAEQIFGRYKGEEKLKWVQAQLEMRGMIFDQPMVEAAVFQLSQAFADYSDDI